MSRTVHMGRQLAVGSVVTVAVSIAAAGWFVEARVASLVRERHASDLRTIVEFGARRAAVESFRPRFGEPEPEGGVPTIEAPAEGSVDGRRVHWLVRNAATGKVLGRSADFPAIELTSGAPGAAVEVLDAMSSVPHRVVGLRLDAEAFDPPGPPRRPDGPPRGRERPERGGRPDRLGPDRPGPDRSGPNRSGPGRGPRRPNGLPPAARGLDFDVFAAVDISSEHALVDAIRRALLLSGAGAALLAGLVLSLNVRFGMRPVGELAQRIERLGPEDLSAENVRSELTLDRDTVELRPIVAALRSNRASLARAFDRQRRFTSDAAHELRTPLAGLRASLEVALRRERSVDQHRDIASECLGVTRSMEGAVEALLLLARAESPSPQDAVPVDLREAVARAADALAAAFDERGVQLEIESLEAPLLVETHAALLDRVVDNLVSNAAAYALPGTVARATFHRTDDVVALEITNACEPLEPDAAAHAHEPFWRADAARTGEHVGLGLSIADSAATALGGALSLGAESAVGRGTFTARLEIPRRP
ncbi:MAG: ATP-binding protein [Planctomycetota bacterium]